MDSKIFVKYFPLLILILVYWFIFPNDIFYKKTDKLYKETDQDKSGLVNSIMFEKLLDGHGPYYVTADNPMLIEYVQNHVLIPPSKLPYNLTRPEVKNSSPEGQNARALSILNNKINGFFIEAGALTGEFWSNSLTLERFYGWTGLLVEANPTVFKELITKNRKAWSANCCLSPFPYPIKVVFRPSYATGKILNSDPSKVKTNEVVVQCFPLLTLLLAINQTHIDYCSLDLEGSELEVVKTMPLHTVEVKVYSIEVYYIPSGKPLVNEYKPLVKEYMKSQGYTYHSNVNLDLFFVKN